MLLETSKCCLCRALKTLCSSVCVIMRTVASDEIVWRKASSGFNIFGSVDTERKCAQDAFFFSLRSFYVFGIEYLLQWCYKMKCMRIEFFEARSTFKRREWERKKRVSIWPYEGYCCAELFPFWKFTKCCWCDDHFTFIFCHLKGHWFICFHMKCLYCILTKLFHVMDSNAKE